MPRLSKRKRHLASISHAGAMATNSKRWLSDSAAARSMKPPPSPLMGETPPALSMGETPPALSMEEPPAPSTEESSPALPMEEPPPTLSMESPLVEELEECQPFFSEYEEIGEDSQLEVDESGDSNISSDDDEVL